MAILPEGKNSSLNDLNFTFDSETAVMEFGGIKTKPIVSIMRDFSAPVKIKFDIDFEELGILAAFDDDPFVRWESVQTMARREIIAGYENLMHGEDYTPSAKLIRIFGRAFSEPEKDFAALLLQLPSTSEMMASIPDCCPEVILSARNAIARNIYEQFEKSISDTIGSFDFEFAFDPSAKSAGKRAFLSSCLYYASFAPAEIANSMLLHAYKSAKNMTDVMAALGALSRIGGEAWQASLDDFSRKWHNNPLVMDKWFSLQAASPAGVPLSTFDQLLNHSAFEITNPNRVRAVVAAFSISNPIAFHDQSGQGYAKLANFLLRLDAVNPIGAARLASAFARATMVCKERREKAKQVLGELSSKKISSLLQEIVAPIVKSL